MRGFLWRISKEMAKFRGIKGVSTMKKADYLEAMLAKDEEEEEQSDGEAAARQRKRCQKGSERGSQRALEGCGGRQGREDGTQKAFEVEALDEKQIKELDSGRP